MHYKAGCKIRWFDGLSGSPGKSQKNGQEDQQTLKQLRGVSPSSFIPPWSSWPSFWLFPGLPDNPSNHLILQPVSGHHRITGALLRTSAGVTRQVSVFGHRRGSFSFLLNTQPPARLFPHFIGNPTPSTGNPEHGEPPTQHHRFSGDAGFLRTPTV